MKMVSTAKYKHDEKRFKAGIPFAKPVINFMERLPDADPAALPNVKMVVLSSDKGMCGAINSGLAKLTRLKTIEEEAKGSTVEIQCCGSKSLAALKRLFGDRFRGSYEECQVTPFNFITASALAEAAIANNP